MKFNSLIYCVIAFIAIILILFGIGMSNDYSKNKIIENYKSEIIYKDSVYNNTIDSLTNKIIYDEETIQYYENQVDSYKILVDSLYEDIDIYKIKLDRIKEYNRIAGQGNNITFLRGWINRVLN